MSVFKNALAVATIMMACSPAFVSAQDFFYSFDEFSRVPSNSATFSEIGDTASLFIFADVNFSVMSFDIDFFNSDSSVVAFTGGTAIDSGGKFLGGTVVVNQDAALSSGEGPTATAGRLFGTSLIGPGIVAGNTSDPEFRAGADGFLLAQVDFEIIGAGTANFSLVEGDLGIFSFTNTNDATFGTGSFTVEDTANVPEPSSAVLLILGAAAVAARRRRI